MAQIIDKKILDGFMAWLQLSENNPNNRKYHDYDYCLNRLFSEAINLNLIKKTDVDNNLFDIAWLKSILNIVATKSSDLKVFDDDKNEGGKGRASLTLFIKFAEQNNAGGVTLPIIIPPRASNDNHELNLILYGPPGTGKTYNTVNYAVAIIEGKDADTVSAEDHDDVLKRYRDYLDKGRIAFTTFHQSYGYEEFIEGIKPDFDADEIKYKRADGVFKEFCEKARNIKQTKNNSDLIKPNATVWKISLDSAGRKGFAFHDKCLDDSCIRVGWDADEDLSLVTEDGKDSARRFMDDMEIGDIVLSCYSQSEIDAIGIITGDYEWHDKEPRLKRFRSVKWLRLWRGKEKYNIKAVNRGKNLTQTTVYKLQIPIDDIIKIVNEKSHDETDKIEYDYNTPYVFIIDEINRGNVSKIFGELITLIEPSKRLGASEEMTCILPYSGRGQPFGVPKNVYILGTMNTADRSLVQLDTALRRRFEFEEMMPKPDLLKITKDGIDLCEMLKAINERITALLDREHQIGHSYFMNLDGSSTVAEVAQIFKKKIIPLLQEYFFEDYKAIEDVLSTAFVEQTKVKVGNTDKTIYSVKASYSADDYIKLYDGAVTASTATTADGEETDE